MSSSEDARSPSPGTSTGTSGGSSGSSGESKTNVNTIDLKLLSPSFDVPASGLYFENLPTTTTLGELRAKITSALPSHPPAARQRLIYFGRVLQRDEDTLAGVFGKNNVCILGTHSPKHTIH